MKEELPLARLALEEAKRVLDRMDDAPLAHLDSWLDETHARRAQTTGLRMDEQLQRDEVATPKRAPLDADRFVRSKRHRSHQPGRNRRRRRRRRRLAISRRRLVARTEGADRRERLFGGLGRGGELLAREEFAVLRGGGVVDGECEFLDGVDGASVFLEGENEADRLPGVEK